MKKDYTTPSMVITSFSSEAVIMASSISVSAENLQTESKFGSLSVGNWNK